MRFLMTVLFLTISLIGCGDDDPDTSETTNTEGESQDDPTFQCQISQGGCEAPETPDALCCPITAEPGDDCSDLGGTADPTCSSVCDAAAESFGDLSQNDDGCWTWDGHDEPPVIAIEP